MGRMSLLRVVVASWVVGVGFSKVLKQEKLVSFVGGKQQVARSFSGSLFGCLFLVAVTRCR